MRIGVVGLGQMGLGMAGRAVAAGAVVAGTDLDPARVAAAAALGVMAAPGPAAVAAQLVVLSLPNDAAVAAVLQALLPAMAPGSVVADTSTLDPLAARGFAQLCAARGVAYLDAPVSGGPAGAAAGTLTMMVGGAAAALEAARPGLALLAARILHVGEAGAGQVAKLVNNLLVATHLAVAGEALSLGQRAGVAPEALLAVVNAASGRSAATEVNFPRWVLSGAFDSGFTTGLMRKDVRLALGLAEAVGAKLDATARAAALWADSAVPDAADFNRVPAAILEGAGR
jgi:3-hydroxyisobutyrate dehydrogenase